MACRQDIRKKILDKVNEVFIEGRYTYYRVNDGTFRVANVRETRGKSRAKSLDQAKEIAIEVKDRIVAKYGNNVFVEVMLPQYVGFPVEIKVTPSELYVEKLFAKVLAEKRTEPISRLVFLQDPALYQQELMEDSPLKMIPYEAWLAQNKAPNPIVDDEGVAMFNPATSENLIPTAFQVEQLTLEFPTVIKPGVELVKKLQTKLQSLYPEIKLNITNNPVWEQGNDVFNQTIENEMGEDYWKELYSNRNLSNREEFESVRIPTVKNKYKPDYENVYHGTNNYHLDNEGNLILTPSHNFENKTESVSLTQIPVVAQDYMLRKQGNIIIKINNDALPSNYTVESVEEIAINGNKPFIVKKGMFEIIKVQTLAEKMKAKYAYEVEQKAEELRSKAKSDLDLLDAFYSEQVAADNYSELQEYNNDSERESAPDWYVPDEYIDSRAARKAVQDIKVTKDFIIKGISQRILDNIKRTGEEFTSFQEYLPKVDSTYGTYNSPHSGSLMSSLLDSVGLGFNDVYYTAANTDIEIEKKRLKEKEVKDLEEAITEIVVSHEESALAFYNSKEQVKKRAEERNMSEENYQKWFKFNKDNERKMLDDLPFQKVDGRIIGQANIKAMSVLIDAINQKQDTLPHEYAHHYIAWFRNTPLVQEAIKKWGSEEALVQSIGEQAVKQKGEAFDWWEKFTKFVMDLFNNLSTKDKQELTNILTDAFLQGVDLETGKIGISRERSLELARKTSGLFNQEIKPGVEELFESNPELANIGTPEQYSSWINYLTTKGKLAGTKVTDILYHGSSQFGFDKFSKEKLGEFTGAGSAKLGFFFSNSLENSFSAYTGNVQKDVVFSDEGNIEGVEGTYGLRRINSILEDLDQGRPFVDFEVRDKTYFVKNTSKSGGISYGIPFKTKEEALEDYKNDDWNYDPDAKIEILENVNYGKYKYSKIDWLQDKPVVYYKEELGKKDSKITISEKEYNKALNKAKEILIKEKANYIKEESKNRVYNVLLDSKDLKEFDDKGNKWREDTYVNRIKQTLSENKDGLVIRNTYDPLLNDVYIVFEPEQIYILGGKEDIEGFRDFVNKPQQEIKEPTPDTRTIKPGVPELFESNPELANAVYEALGFKSVTSFYWEDTYENWGNETIEIPEFKKRIEKLAQGRPVYYEYYTFETPKQRTTKDSKDIFQVAAYIISNKNEAEKLIKEYGYNYTLKEFLDLSEKETFTDNKKELITKIYGNQITPQQKQQAQQLYSQYLDTIFPNSQVKDIIYHGTDLSVDAINFKTDRGGIFLASTPTYASYFSKEENVYPMLVNFNNSYQAKQLTDNIDQEAIKQIKSRGFDSVIGKGGLSKMAQNQNVLEYIAFTPKQLYPLGTKQDLERFKQFAQTTPITPTTTDITEIPDVMAAMIYQNNNCK